MTACEAHRRASLRSLALAGQNGALTHLKMPAWGDSLTHLKMPAWERIEDGA